MSTLLRGWRDGAHPAAEGATAPATRPRVGSALVVVHGNAVLLGRRAKEPNRGRWVLPGGGVQPFESLEDAARRELLEEAGLDVVVGSQIGAFEILEPPDEHRLIVYSWATPVNRHTHPGSDVSELRYWGREELPNADLTPIVRDVLTSIAWL